MALFSTPIALLVSILLITCLMVARKKKDSCCNKVVAFIKGKLVWNFFIKTVQTSFLAHMISSGILNQCVPSNYISMTFVYLSIYAVFHFCCFTDPIWFSEPYFKKAFGGIHTIQGALLHGPYRFFGLALCPCCWPVERLLTQHIRLSTAPCVTNNPTRVRGRGRLKADKSVQVFCCRDLVKWTFFWRAWNSNYWSFLGKVSLPVHRFRCTA